MLPSRSSGDFRNGTNNIINPEKLKARLLLFVACIWPLVVLALFAASSPNQEHISAKEAASEAVHKLRGEASRLNIHNILDRVDIMGYGPTHPRVAVVVVGEEKEYLISSVESVFRNTDLNRIFLICAVLDGHDKDKKLLEEMRKIDSGSVPHWHGYRPDIHFSKENGEQDEEDEDPHGRKIHVLFQPERLGVAASRLEAVEFVQLLQSKHEEAGLKRPEEDLILLLLQAGSQLTDRKWLAPVTLALIVPPPILSDQDESVAMKLANAVSFHSEGNGKRMSFDEQFTPIIGDATAADINLSSGQSYPTPALNGAAIAMRLDTFVNLPAQDPTLEDSWLADLDLALNLWLCGDGIDILQDAEVTSFEEVTEMPLEPEMAARFAAVWMEESFALKFLHTYSSKITRLDWETKITHAKQEEDFPKDMPKKCRSFEWYAKEINTDLSKVFEEPEEAEITANKQEINKEEAKAYKELLGENVKAGELTKQKRIRAEPENIEEPVKEEPPELPEEPKEDAAEEEIPDPAQNHGKKPAVPLRAENLEIVQKATPVDISFVDISGGSKDHPHMGAKDENGNWGYIHDETALHKNPPDLTWKEGAERKACVMRDNNFRMMNERVIVDMEYDKKMEESVGEKRDKIFCLVYTIESGHHKIPLIRETWG